MKDRILGSRAMVSILAVAMAAVVVVVGGLVLINPFKDRINYCASLPDAIGLYVGNTVTQRGIPVGEVTAIEPRAGGARVEFAVDADYALQGDAAATTVSDTLVADRRLEVNGTDGTRWPSDRCIDRTSTPKSISSSLDALSDIAKELDDGAGGASGSGQLRDALVQIDKATQGAGTRINHTIKRLASALRSPDVGIGQVGQLIDTLTSLSQSITANWGTIEHFLGGFEAILSTINGVWVQAASIIRSLVVVLPWFNDIFIKYGGLIETELFHRAVPFLNLVAANVGPIKNLLNMIPVLSTAFHKAKGPDGRVTVAYASPRVVLPAQDAAAVCAQVNQVRPGKCDPAAGGSQTDLTSLVGSMIGVPR